MQKFISLTNNWIGWLIEDLRIYAIRCPKRPITKTFISKQNAIKYSDYLGNMVLDHTETKNERNYCKKRIANKLTKLWLLNCSLSFQLASETNSGDRVPKIRCVHFSERKWRSICQNDQKLFEKDLRYICWLTTRCEERCHLHEITWSTCTPVSVVILKGKMPSVGKHSRDLCGGTPNLRQLQFIKKLIK